jgi:hypothetical protein
MANTTGQKFGGRSKGTSNKTTSQIREHYQKLISDNIDLLDKDLKSLEPLHRLKILIELSKYVLPSLRSTELTTSNNDKRFQPLLIQMVTENNK